MDTGRDDDTTRGQLQTLQARNAKLSVLLETGQLLSSVISIDELLKTVMGEVTRVLGAERSSLFLLDRDRHELWSKVAQGIDAKEIRLPLSQGIVGHVARTGEIVNLSDAYDDQRFDREWDLKTGFRTRSLLTVPLRNRKGEILGVVQALNKQTGAPFDADDIELLQALGSQAAISIDNALLYRRIEELFEAFVDTIVYAIDARDPITAGHSHRVAAYSSNLAKALHRATDPDVAGIQFTVEELRALEYASKLHDVGKIGVRENVLCKRYTLLPPELALVEERIQRSQLEAELAGWKAGRPPEAAVLEFYTRLLQVVQQRRTPQPLSDDHKELLERAHQMGLLTDRQFQCFALTRGNLIDREWADMRSHVSKSYDLLCQIPWPEPLSRVPEIAWSHHEKLDGSGYPRGVTGAQFPFEGQIVAVADIYDALTASDRPYKRSYSPADARAILDEEVDRKHIDGRLVREFFAGDCSQLPDTIPRPAAEPPPDAEM